MRRTVLLAVGLLATMIPTLAMPPPASADYTIKINVPEFGPPTLERDGVPIPTASITADIEPSTIPAIRRVDLHVTFPDGTELCGGAVEGEVSPARPGGQVHLTLPCGSQTAWLGAWPDRTDVAIAGTVVTLTVSPRADMTTDGLLSVGDVLTYVTLFLAGHPRADFTDDGLVTAADIFEFIARYFGT